MLVIVTLAMALLAATANPGLAQAQPPAGAQAQPPAGAQAQPPAGAQAQPPAGNEAQPPAEYVPPRCELLPLPQHQVSLRVDGVERTRWHFGPEYPRPFFFPFNGPSGESLTRMGHPGAQNHDHHRSIWVAHNDVAGVDFWSDRTEARLRQKHWYAYHDGHEEALLGVACGWYDGAGRELMQHDLLVALRPMGPNEQSLELQITLRPGEKAESVELGRTNFGLLAVRVAKSISAHFGGGQLSDSEGRTGEEAIFGRQARWMDYSGPVAAGTGPGRKVVLEGITFHDHPDNPRYPTHWHVREDGWMGAAFCLAEGYTITADSPLTLRYQLDSHRGGYDAARAARSHEQFARRPGLQVIKSPRKHRQFEVQRLAAGAGEVPPPAAGSR